MMLLPVVLIAGLFFAGMNTWHDAEVSALGEEVEEVLEETLEEKYLCGSAPVDQWVSVFVERERVAEQCNAGLPAFLSEHYLPFGSACWNVPLRI